MIFNSHLAYNTQCRIVEGVEEHFSCNSLFLGPRIVLNWWKTSTHFFSIFLLVLFFPLFAVAEPLIGLAELSNLLAKHQPQAAKGFGVPIERLERSITLGFGTEPTVFQILGFNQYGCNKCHDSEDLIQKAVSRMGNIVNQLTHRFVPPLRQYIIQPYADGLLKSYQFAHTTFDTIRLFPRTIIVDAKVYRNATQHHETIHLSQTFLGYANELEAYSWNIRSDPRFLLLYYPYFSNVMSAFFVKEYEHIRREYFSWPIDENKNVPGEVQRYMQPFDKNKLARLSNAVVNMDPLLQEVSRLNRSYPLQGAYLSAQTGIRSLLLDIAAAQLLSPLPALTDREFEERAIPLMASQMERTDNTRLGYLIDRKKEALLTINNQLGRMDQEQQLALYFSYLKSRFVKGDNTINLIIPDKEDFQAYVNNKLEDIRKFQQFPGITTIEKKAGKRTIKAIKTELFAHEKK